MSANHRSITTFKPHYSFKMLQFVSVNSFGINIYVLIFTGAAVHEPLCSFSGHSYRKHFLFRWFKIFIKVLGY